MPKYDPHSDAQTDDKPEPRLSGKTEAAKKQPLKQPKDEEEASPGQARRGSSPALRLSAWLLALVLLLIILGWALGTIL